MIDIKKELVAYFESKQNICEYFDYKDTWSDYPLADETDVYWFINQGTIFYADEPMTKELAKKGQYYTGIVRIEYRQPNYSLIVVDTQCDDNIFLSVFDNSKEITDTEIIECFA
jgi:hypothetical protein